MRLTPPFTEYNFLILLLGLLGLLWSGAPHAQTSEYANLATISATMGINGGRVCLGEATRNDLGCPTYAPSVNTAGLLTANTMMTGGLTVTGATSISTVSATTGDFESIRVRDIQLNGTAISKTVAIIPAPNGFSIISNTNPLGNGLWPTGWAGGLVTWDIMAASGLFAGYVGIGISSSAPQALLHVRGQTGVKTTAIISAESNTYRNDWPTTWGGGLATWDIVGNSTYFSAYSTRSDRRYKRDIHALDTDEMMVGLMKLKPVSYRYKDPSVTQALQYGLIAQDVRAVWPNLVTGEETAQGRLGLNYPGLIAPLITAAQVLKTDYDELRRDLTKSQGTVTQLQLDNTRMHHELSHYKLALENISERLKVLEKSQAFKQ